MTKSGGSRRRPRKREREREREESEKERRLIWTFQCRVADIGLWLPVDAISPQHLSVWQPVFVLRSINCRQMKPLRTVSVEKANENRPADEKSIFQMCVQCSQLTRLSCFLIQCLTRRSEPRWIISSLDRRVSARLKASGSPSRANRPEFHRRLVGTGQTRPAFDQMPAQSHKTISIRHKTNSTHNLSYALCLSS